MGFTKSALKWIAAVTTAIVAAVGLSSLRSHRLDNKGLSPIATPAVAATVDVSLKIESELLALLELEEQQPGHARDQAAEDIFFDAQGRVRVIVELDPNVITVQPSWTVGKPVGEQEAARLVIAYGAHVVSENELSNHITAYIPLSEVKAVAQDGAIDYIWLDRIVSQRIPQVTGWWSDVIEEEYAWLEG